MRPKLTRRQLVVAAASARVALAQETKAPQTAVDDLQTARNRVRQNGQKLTDYQMPMSTEPALHFKA